MQNVLALIWRPKKGMEIYDLGGHRYLFVFLSCIRFTEGHGWGPWTLEQSLLLYHKLEGNENAHLVKLNKMKIWVQVYDLLSGMLSNKILESIGNYVGTFIKSDPQNLNGSWKLFSRIIVAMDVEKPIIRRMRIKREGGEWTWINFKYERLSNFCFLCGLMGHSDRDCGVVYANPNKIVERSYGTWLRALVRGGKNQNIGVRWLRNGLDGGQNWNSKSSGAGSSTNVAPTSDTGTRFMELDGQVTEIVGEMGAIYFSHRNQGIQSQDNVAKIVDGIEQGGKEI